MFMWCYGSTTELQRIDREIVLNENFPVAHHLDEQMCDEIGARLY